MTTFWKQLRTYIFLNPAFISEFIRAFDIQKFKNSVIKHEDKFILGKFS